MAFRLSFSFGGVTELSRILDIMANDLNDFKPMFQKIANDFRKTERGIFDSQGAFEGGSKWPALSPAYKQIKDRKYPGRRILEATGAMRKSLTLQAGSGHISQPTTDSLTIGTRDKKAPYHQSGTSKMPQRKVLFLTDAEKSRLTRIAHEYIFRSINGGRT
jgi:phage gpG-like protein